MTDYADCTLIVPTYNEVENIRYLLPAIRKICPLMEIFVVDDASEDGTAEAVLELGKKIGGVAMMKRPGKLGLGTAYRDGFQHQLKAPFRFFFQMDADFSHNPEYLPDLYQKAQYFDVVVGSRYCRNGGTRNWSLLRKAISRSGTFYAKCFFPTIPLSDLTSGFKCLSRKVLETIDIQSIRSNGYAFQIEMNVRAFRQGFRLGEIPIIFTDRRTGQSKLDRRIVLEAIIKVPRFRFFS